MYPPLLPSHKTCMSCQASKYFSNPKQPTPTDNPRHPFSNYPLPVFSWHWKFTTCYPWRLLILPLTRTNVRFQDLQHSYFDPATPGPLLFVVSKYSVKVSHIVQSHFIYILNLLCHSSQTEKGKLENIQPPRTIAVLFCLKLMLSHWTYHKDSIQGNSFETTIKLIFKMFLFQV